MRLSNTLNVIGYSAFCNCYSLRYILVPNSVTVIESHAFYQCQSLTKAIIGDGVTSLGTCSFQLCRKLSELVLGNSLLSIGQLAFSGCDNLISVTLPPSVNTIADVAFDGCDNLTSITLSESLNSMGENILQYCDKLQTIECPAAIPMPFSGVYPFTDDNYQRATLYVPVGSLAAYRTTLPWSPFRSIQEKDFSGIDETVADGNDEINPAAPCDVFDLSGRRVATGLDGLTPGLYILRQGEVVKKQIVR